MRRTTPRTLARRIAGGVRLLSGARDDLKRTERRLMKEQERHIAQLTRRMHKRLKRIERRLPPEPAPALVGTLDYQGARIELRARTKQERFRLRAAQKEPWTVEWMETWIAPGECLYDIGANVGAYSLMAALGPARAYVVALEPGFANYATLCENVAHNRAGDRVMPLGIALSDRTGTTSFNYRDTGSGEAMHGMGEEDAGRAAFRQAMLTLTLDDLVGRFALRAPNHLKLDVDGAEQAVLEGAERTLSSPDLRTVLTEVSVDDAESVGGALEGAGLERLQRTDRRVKYGKVVDHWYELWTRPHAR